MKDSKRLEAGQVWMFFGPEGRGATTLLIKLDESSHTWLTLRTRWDGRMLVHKPVLHFIGHELDEDDEDVTFIKVA